MGVIGFIYPGIGFTLSVATAIGSAYAAYNTKNMSCKIRHYYHKDYPNGWQLTTFCEQIKTTWYPQADYGGKSTITTHYRVGYSY